MPRKPPPRTLVYSTELGRMCPACGRPLAECRCRDRETLVVGDGNIRVGRESKGRAGKAVTLVTGVPLPHDGLAQLATRLKKRCGSGGTVKDGVIEIQGDHRDTVMGELQAMGYRAKRVGA